MPTVIDIVKEISESTYGDPSVLYVSGEGLSDPLGLLGKLMAGTPEERAYALDRVEALSRAIVGDKPYEDKSYLKPDVDMNVTTAQLVQATMLYLLDYRDPSKHSLVSVMTLLDMSKHEDHYDNLDDRPFVERDEDYSPVLDYKLPYFPGHPSLGDLETLFFQVGNGGLYDNSHNGSMKWVTTEISRNYDGWRPGYDNTQLSMDDPAFSCFIKFKKITWSRVEKAAVELALERLEPLALECGQIKAPRLAHPGMVEPMRGDRQDFYFSPKRASQQIQREVIGSSQWMDFLSATLLQGIIRMRSTLSGRGNNPVIKPPLLVGPTGVGKSLFLSRLAEEAHMKYFRINMSLITEEGYRGASLSDLMAQVHHYLEEEKGGWAIVALDEIDKIAGDDWHDFRRGVQLALLPLLEGGKVTMSHDVGRGAGEYYTLNTDRIQFYAMGAFMGIENIVRDRLKRESGATGMTGSASNDLRSMSDDDLRAQVTCDDLTKFGLSSELVGRLGSIVSIPSLTKDDYRQIIELELEKYKHITPSGVMFDLSDEAYDRMADIVAAKQLGARPVSTMLAQYHAVVLMETNADMFTKGAILVPDEDSSGLKLEFEPFSKQELDDILYP